MKRLFFTGYVVVSLLVIMVLLYNFNTDRTFRQAVEKERANQEVVGFFNEVCLGSENGGAHIVRKWKTPMRLYIIKDSSYTVQVAAIKRTIKTLNKLFTDRFNISLVTDTAKANAYLVLCADKNVKNYPQFKTEFAGVNNLNIGYFYTVAINNAIVKSAVFINTCKPIAMQKSAIMEEIAQSLGMGNDTEIYRNSIFYQYKYDFKLNVFTPSALDAQIIKLLYNPKMKPGLNRLQTTPLINEILDGGK
jgi:hypothetical protein